MRKLFLFALFFIIPLFSQAQDLFMYDSYKASSFNPTDAYFFWKTHNDKVASKRAQIFYNENAARFFIATKVDAALVGNDIEYGSVLMNGNEKLLFSDIRTRRESLTAFSMPLDEMREALQREQSTVLKNQQRYAEEEQILKQLRLQVASQTSMDEILSMEEEVEKLNREQMVYERDALRIETAIAELKRLPTPRRYSRREVELNAQLSEMAKKIGNEEDFQNRLARLKGQEVSNGVSVIEETQFYDIEELEEEYARLRVLIERKKRGQEIPTFESSEGYSSSDYLSLDNQ